MGFFYRTLIHMILNTSLMGCVFREEDAIIAFCKIKRREKKKK
jgi:hypothetical protein